MFQLWKLLSYEEYCQFEVWTIDFFFLWFLNFLQFPMRFLCSKRGHNSAQGAWFLLVWANGISNVRATAILPCRHIRKNPVQACFPGKNFLWLFLAPCTSIFSCWLEHSARAARPIMSTQTNKKEQSFWKWNIQIIIVTAHCLSSILIINVTAHPRGVCSASRSSILHYIRTPWLS